MAHNRIPQIGHIAAGGLEGYEAARARLERARAIQRALRRLTGRHARPIR